MSDAQQRSRDINRKLEISDRRLLLIASITALLLLMFASLTYLQVLKINARVEAQIVDSREDAKKAIQSVKEDNQRAHGKQNAFLECIILLQLDQRTEAALKGCRDAANNSTTNNTPTSFQSAVINPTLTEEASTQPPKEPEQPQPPQPVPMAPPPQDVQPALNLLDIINLPENIKPVLELRQ
jgi:hypothetical protein